MSKSIKVSEDVYNMLLQYQRPRETFSELIMRLLTAAILLAKVEPLIRGQHDYLQWKQEREEAEKAAHG